MSDKSKISPGARGISPGSQGEIITASPLSYAVTVRTPLAARREEMKYFMMIKSNYCNEVS